MSAPGDEADDRAGDALGHLQAAAQELIAAARAFLDVAEEVVEDPKAGEALLETLGGLVRKVVPGSGTAEGSNGDAGGVEHIHLSD